jgi:hypothetical protein
LFVALLITRRPNLKVKLLASCSCKFAGAGLSPGLRDGCWPLRVGEGVPILCVADNGQRETLSVYTLVPFVLNEIVIVLAVVSCFEQVAAMPVDAGP